MLETFALNFPTVGPVPGRNKPVPYAFVFDDVFPLQTEAV